MIKLDRKRRKPKQDEEEEEQERTEVDFTSDDIVGKLEGSANGRRGGLEIRRKSNGEPLDNLEIPADAIRKGPAMPSADVLAVLAQREVVIPEADTEQDDKKAADIGQDTKSIASKDSLEKEPAHQSSNMDIAVAKADSERFKAPGLPAPSSDNPISDKSLPTPAPHKSKTAAKVAPTFSYREPVWTSVCEEESYKLEVLKSGKIIGKYDLKGKSCHVLGKWETCDLRLEHPSISRYHCILQWHGQDKTWKLLDYGSSNGVKLNKMKLRPHQYVRCTVGSVLEIGNSTRKYIMVGPVDDQFEESKESGFELRDQFKKKQRKLEKRMLGEEDSDEEEKDKGKSKEEEGVNWGFTEDAWDDDDADDINASVGGDGKTPSFLKSDLNPNAFYHKDPLKAINHFFTSDLMEPPWDFQQTPKGKWICKLELPIGDGASGITVEAEGEGKLGAKTHCALEACMMLDRHGMFDQNAKARSKRDKLEQNDFYDSDEDNFYDRTGDLENKRKKRKLATNRKQAKEKAITYDEIMQNLNKTQAEYDSLIRKIERDRQQREQFKASDDPLEAFMKTVKSGGALDSMTRSKMHRRKAELFKDLAHWKRLATAAAPAALPDILKPTSLTSGPRKGMSLMKGRVKSSGSMMAKPKIPPSKKPTIQSNPVKDVVENDSDEEEKPKDLTEKKNVDRKIIKLFDVDSEKPTKTTSQDDSTANKVLEVPKSNQKRKIAGTLSGITKTKFNAEYAVSGDKDSIELDVKRKKNDKKLSQSSRQFDVNYEDDEMVSTWVPPENQSGDGSTALNKKLGY